MGTHHEARLSYPRCTPARDGLPKRMDGAGRLTPRQAYRRVVRLPGGTVLNRYWDDRPEPRPESYRQDYEQAEVLPLPTPHRPPLTVTRMAAASPTTTRRRDVLDYRWLPRNSRSPMEQRIAVLATAIVLAQSTLLCTRRNVW
jgi:neutral trehalase